MCLISIPVVFRVDRHIFLHFKLHTPMHGSVCFNMNKLIAGAQTNRLQGERKYASCYSTCSMCATYIQLLNVESSVFTLQLCSHLPEIFINAINLIYFVFWLECCNWSIFCSPDKCPALQSPAYLFTIVDEPYLILAGTTPPGKVHQFIVDMCIAVV